VDTSASATTVSVEASGWDALDALAAPSNAPVPSLSHQSSGISSNPSMQSQDDDVFGDFAGTGSSDALTHEPSTAPSKDEGLTGAEGAQPSSLIDFVGPGAAGGYKTGGGDESHLVVEPTDSDDLGDFFGTESSVSKERASSAFRSHQEDISKDAQSQDQVSSTDSGHLKSPAFSPKKPPLPPTGSRSVQYPPPPPQPLSSPYSMERTDSAYYSARTNSIATTFDLGDFEDAVENIDGEDQWQEAEQGEASGDEWKAPVAVDSDDPFAAFDTLTAPAPTLPPLPPLPAYNLDSNTSLPDAHSEISTPTKSQESPNDIAKNDADDDTDEFGDFEAVQMEKGTGTEGVPESKGEEIEDDFGDFAGFESEDGESLVEPGHQEVSQEPDLLGFSSAPAETQPADVIEDDFGDFDEAPPNPAGTTNASAVAVAVSSDVDDFGDFEGVDPDKNAPSDVLAPPNQAADDDEFGDFSSFGEFGSSPEVRDDVLDVRLDDPERKKLVLVREYLVGQSQQLPEVFRTQLGKPGSHVDFGDCFDANIGLDTPLSEGRKRRGQRCAQLLGLLSSTQSKLASTYWAQAIEVARDELAMGSFLLEEASGLSSAEKILVRQPLETMVLGLGEFVRVARLIAASIGDLLMLDDSALLTIDTFASSWCSMALLKGYLEVENLWKNVEKLGKLLGLSSKEDSAFPLESLVDIRRRAAAANPSDPLCQFSLQPLSGADVGKTTTSPVRWKGQPFMACTANFLVHKFVF
jgi:hypothetical protein